MSAVVNVGKSGRSLSSRVEREFVGERKGGFLRGRKGSPSPDDRQPGSSRIVRKRQRLNARADKKDSDGPQEKSSAIRCLGSAQRAGWARNAVTIPGKSH